MIEFYRASTDCIERGDFPLNHDCILTVVYLDAARTFYTCRAQDSGALASILSSLSIVQCVHVSPVEDFNL